MEELNAIRSSLLQLQLTLLGALLYTKITTSQNSLVLDVSEWVMSDKMKIEM
jgi:hypothetical protein